MPLALVFFARLGLQCYNARVLAPNWRVPRHPRRIMKRRLRLILGLVISLAFLYLAMRGISWHELWELFRKANYLYLIPAFFLLILINWTRAYRWRLLMYPNDRLPLLRVFHIVNIGYSFNNVFPAKAGEVVRAYLLGRVIPGGIGQALSTLLIERLLDVLSVVVLLVLLIPFVSLPDPVTKGGLVFGTVAILGTIVLLILSRFGDRGVEWVWRFVGRIPLIGHSKKGAVYYTPVKTALRNLLEGFGVLRVGRLLPGILIGSALVWLGYATFNYLLMAVFNMTELPFLAAALVLCATGLSMVVPSTAGAMGVFEWAAVQALAVYGLGESRAFGYAFGLHAFTNIILILFGLVGLLAEGLSYESIRKEAMQGADSPSPADASQ